VGKREGSAARARVVEETLLPESGGRSSAKVSPTALTAIDGDPALPMALDRLIHERVRLAIVSALAVHESLTFNELKALLDASDGNVSVHARKLEDAGYISCTKGFDGRIPRTEYRLAATGRTALTRYLSHMEALIKRVGNG
jgi:DNA-binding transcriptional ArsR family regulator